MRWKPFRITEAWAKVAYVVVAWFGLSWVMRLLFAFSGLPAVGVTALDVLWGFVVVLVGSRAFRIAGEPFAPPRAWWRATGRPAAGFWLAAVFLLGLVTFFLPSQLGALEAWLYAGSSLMIGAFYLQSSIRLVRGDAFVPSRPSSAAQSDARLIRPDRRLSR